MTKMLVKRVEKAQVIETLHPRPVTYTVTFNSNGGSSVNSQTVIKGDTATEPNDPTKEGYVFADWLLGGEVYDFSTPVTANITLDASWEAIVTHNVTVSIGNEGGEGVLNYMVMGGEFGSTALTYGGDPFVFQVPDGQTIGQVYNFMTLFDNTQVAELYNVVSENQEPITQDTSIVITVNDNVAIISVSTEGGTGVLKYTEIGGEAQQLEIKEGVNTFTTKAVAAAGDALSTLYSAIAMYTSNGETLVQDLSSETVTGVTNIGVAVPVVPPENP